MKMSIFFLLIISMVILTGCPVSESVVLYNNSTETVIIELNEKTFTWPHKTEIKLAESGADIDWEDLYWQGELEYFPLLILSVGQERKKFKLIFPDLPKKFISDRRDGSRRYSLQLEDRMQLYIVPSNEKLPIREYSLKILLEPYQ